MARQNKQNKAKPVEAQATPARQWLGGRGLCLYPYCIAGAALIAVFGVLLCYESDYLLRVQELNLFLYTPLFFQQQLVVAGGLLTWLGTYFTQYFFHPWLGTLLLCLWLGLLMWLAFRAFRVSRRWAPLLLVPAAMVLLTDFDLGYWLFYLKLRGHFFITVMGASLAVALVWGYRLLVPLRRGLHLVFMVGAAVLAYPLAGFYSLLAVALMGLIGWRLRLSLLQKVVATVVAIVCMVFVPLLYYRHVFYQASADAIWWQALPVYPDTEGFSPYYYPYVVLCLSLALMALCYRSERSAKPIAHRLWWGGAQVVLLTAVVGATWHFWFRDDTFHEELRMNACVDRCDWEGVLSEVRQHDGEPTRMIVMYKNLALFKLGRAGDEMYTYRDGAKDPACTFPLRMAQVGGKNIYLHYGLPNYCYRWCLEDGVEYGWRAEYLKYLVRCALLNGEHEVARKYIDLLRQTRYHREWAEHYVPMASMFGEDEVKRDPELGPIVPLLPDGDVLGSDQALIELFLMNLQAGRITANPLCAELALINSLQMKNIQAFWRAFWQYTALHRGQHVPRHFQEAAYLYGHLENGVDISQMPFDDEVRQSYEGFMQMAGQCRGMSEEQMKTAFYPYFGKTFYYNYFLLRNMKSY